ncbi:sialidase family protein [Montanilutibacter psychrotolerans]|uniref:Exo-alpha-sialidase n=1 Tax=Montanilutibacter psychrotolerans TaxID=1327343 RepID=A0A3M8SSL0_9GAMM|nr:sialidase family protein [Lysobacter psychrotolerans]RNF83753.1 exo-alpha-sialidase [Lysobacter psychrotolerans]
MSVFADPSFALRRTRLVAAVVIAVVVSGCNRTPSVDDAPAPPTLQPAVAAPPIRIEPWRLPVGQGAAQPDLVATSDGRLLLSWIESRGDDDAAVHTLQFASLDATAATATWSAPRTIAQGRDWFVNWADTPHIAVTADGALWAHWLQKSAAATYAYDIALVRSSDGGARWSAPVLVNDDGTASEHGFVSLWPAGRDRLGVAWLDGRAMAQGDAVDHDAHAGHAAPAGATDVPGAPTMSLRSTTFAVDLARHGDTALDLSTCDCCQTDVAATANGAVLAYRDRSDDEIRDIRLIRQVDGQWQPSQPVHADGWKMPACPVNGPALATNADAVLVGWYTAADDTPQVRLARSADGGRTFSAPIVVERGAAVQGRVAVALDDRAAWVLWLREDARGQSIWLARYSPDLTSELQRVEVARLHGRGRATGFPQLELAGNRGHAVWTDVVGGTPQLHGAVFIATQR